MAKLRAKLRAKVFILGTGANRPDRSIDELESILDEHLALR